MESAKSVYTLSDLEKLGRCGQQCDAASEGRCVWRSGGAFVVAAVAQSGVAGRVESMRNISGYKFVRRNLKKLCGCCRSWDSMGQIARSLTSFWRWEAMDEVDELAKKLGAVNTVVCDDDKRLIGGSTKRWPRVFARGA